MKHAGIARRAAAKLILVPLLAVFAAGLLGALLGWPAWLASLAVAVAALWLLFAGFTVYFFRDPEAETPAGAGVGRVAGPRQSGCHRAMLKESPCFAGPCHRISIFLSVIDVHVQNAPVSGKIAGLQHAPGQFLSALKAESAAAERKCADRICLERNARRKDRRAADRRRAGAADRAVCQEWATSCSGGSASA